MSRQGPLCLLLLASTVLAGCGGGQPHDDAAARQVKALWADRTPYTGDNPKVVALAQDAAFGPTGSYTIALQTDTVPYSATVSFSQLEKPFDTIDFSSSATLLLGTVGNLGEVSVRFEGTSYTLTAGSASMKLGYDVKALGRDQQRLSGYVQSLQD